MTINLRTCQIGQPLRMRNGELASYDGRCEDYAWPHTVSHRRGIGTRTNAGHVFDERHPDDADIVEILPMPSSSPKPDPLIFGASIPGSEPVEGLELTEDAAVQLWCDGVRAHGAGTTALVRFIYAAGYRAGREAKP